MNCRRDDENKLTLKWETVKKEVVGGVGKALEVARDIYDLKDIYNKEKRKRSEC